MNTPQFPRSGSTRLGDDKLPVWKKSPADGQYFINSIAVSADGGKVVGGTFYHVYGGASAASRRSDAAGFAGAAESSSSDDGTFGTYCYDQDGNLLWKNEFTGWQGVYWVAVSADGSKAASGGNMTQSPQAGFVRAFDATTGALLLDYATSLRVNEVALSANGNWLVSAAESLVLFRFDSATGAYVKADAFTPSASGSGTNAVVSLGISADGLVVVFSDYAGNIGVLANTNGQLTLLRQYKLPSSFCHMVALTPDGRSFAAGGSAGTFYLCETAKFIVTAKPTYTYSTGLPDPVYGVAVAAEGGVFAGVVNSGPDAGFVYVVDIVDFAPNLQVKFATARNPNSASLNLAAGLLAVADGHPDGTPGHFYLFNGITDEGLPIVTPALEWQYQTGNMSWPIAISANGKAVVGGSDDSYIYYFTP